MQKQNPEQTAFIITGMHRSGTSLTASILQSAGVHIGRNLLGADHVNIKGHFENIDFYHLHMNILDSQGASSAGWTLQDNLEIKEEFVDRAKELIEQNALSAVWGWKEPRTTLFLEFWAKLLPEAKFLLIYRSPWEVADSLYRRQDEIFQTQPELAIKYWQHYNQKILNFYNQEQHRCLLTNLNTIIQNQTAYIDTINQKFNVELSYPAPTAYDPSLLKTEISSNSQKPTLIDYYFPEAIELYQELEGRAWHPEQTPDFSWQDLLKPSLYRSWAFQDWANGRRLEQENKSLKAQLQDQQAEVQEAQLIKTELEQTKSQLKTAEALLDQSQSQLQETETVLEKSQTQLQRTESVLQESHTQLNQTRIELEATKAQLSQAQFDVMRYQSQLHQTQEELEYYELNWPQVQDDLTRYKTQLGESEAKIYEAEALLSQLMMQLQQTKKREERFQIQLHQTVKELEQKTTQLHQEQAALQQATDQVKQLKRDLKRSNSQLYQVEGELDLYHSQLEQSVSQLEIVQMELTQTQSQFQDAQQQLEQQKAYIQELETSVEQLEQVQAQLTQTQSQYQQTKRDLKQKQAQIHQLQTELKRSQAQLHELQVELAQSQAQLEQMQERQRLEQTMAEDPKPESEINYNLLIWDAWNAYRNGKLPLMKQHLQQALKLTKTSPSETILTWLETFSKLSLAQGFELDSHGLTHSEEWQQLMRQMMVKKTMPLPFIKSYPSTPEQPESEPIALSGAENHNLN
ncbi:Paramyosin [Planktothrix tepida]|uniref:Chromosome segregation ATPase-like protein n=1 Tax=Planktothrix tepida PCC 9214 TaxID=671072 RepID=A0A1J1LRY8_9CYAN|nr:sulfotransferase [Planktothrix tepida]CAD5961656.1 Paramyosin [Planktothrix tepida]CUR34778.1 Chromosome segregation ATPase-like protein [Planktothrix tepida PCC 9214]